MKLTSVYTDNGTIVKLTPEAMQFTERTIVTCNHRLLEQISILDEVASTETRVIIFGESGTQKQRYAEYIHKHSLRSFSPYLRFDCAATPIHQYEETLFGASKSVVDGRERIGLLEIAAGGMLLLDGISEMPGFICKKFDHFLDYGMISKKGSNEMFRPDVRLLMTCSRSFDKLMSQNAETAMFIQKLATTFISITPLRERPEDIALLALYYMNQVNKRIGCSKQMGSDLFREILNYSWPGNERELQSFIEQTVMASADDILNEPRQIGNTPQSIIFESDKNEGDVPENESKSLKEMVNEYELMLIHQSIKKYGSLRKAAKALQIAPSALSRKLSAEAAQKTEEIE